MRRIQQRIRGVSLIEVTLVLVIMSAILVMGVKQYQLYRLSFDAEVLQQNVNLIAQAAAGFYQANCNYYDPVYIPNSSPDFQLQPTTSGPVVLDIQTGLQDAGFLSTSLPLSALVDHPADTSFDGYILQFNQITPRPRMECMDETCTTTTQIGTIVNWNIQVAAKLKDPTIGSQLKSILNATCLSSLDGAIITPCSEIPTPDPSASSREYIVFTRSPMFSMPNNDMESTTWTLAPNQKIFKQQYTTLPINYLTGPTSHSPEYQYFYCGS